MINGCSPPAGLGFPETPIILTQPLVALTTLDLSYGSFHKDIEPSCVAILEPLFSCTTVVLAEVRFSYVLGRNLFRKHYFNPGTLETIAAALEKCPGTPLIRWYLSVDGDSARRERQLVRFTASLQVGLPNIHHDRLQVQNSMFADDWLD